MEIIDKLGWIYIKDKKILATRSKGKDVYYIPGGKREKEETDKEALVREVKEELGIELIPESIKFISKFKAQAYGRSKGTILQMTCYSGDFKGEMAPSSEIEEMSWLNYDYKEKATPMLKIILDWLEEKGLID